MSNTFKLNNGNDFPLIGYGTYCITGFETIRSVINTALSTGYRSFDTASMYENEKDIGISLKELLPKYNLKREDILLTSKLHPEDHGAIAEDAARKSIKNLQCEYLDLYLIHWPGVENLAHSDPNNAVLRRQSWSAMVKLHKEGLLKNIGVSNYTAKHIRQLVADCDGVKPVVNQIEWHPHHHPEDILEECRRNDILLQAYCSLGGSTNNGAVINDPEVLEIAEKLGKPVALVLLKWALQRNIAIIPKSVTAKYIRDNFLLDFTIPEELMNKLSNLPTKRRYEWNSVNIV